MVLFYQESGDTEAPLIVFLHGGGVSSWMWEKQIEELTDYHCVTIDLPEHGQNKHSSKFSIDSSAREVLELIQNLAIGKRVTVIGFSLGAQVLIQMISLQPTRIDYAIINSALVKPAKFGKRLISPFIRLTFPLIKNRAFSKLQAKTLMIPESLFETYFHESRHLECETLVRIIDENMSFKIPERFSEAKGKILVTAGEREKSMMKKSALEIVNHNPNCTGLLISGVGHGLPMAKPEQFNRLIRCWVNGGEVFENGEENGIRQF